MALSSLPVSFNGMLLSPERKFTVLASSKVAYSTYCKPSNKLSNNVCPKDIRQSAKFKPTIWTYDYIQSLSSNYKEEKYLEQIKALRKEVRKMLGRLMENQLDQLELIDELQRLGIAYHFSNEIKDMLDNMYSMGAFKRKNNLYATALEFRLLRQHGYDIPTDVFTCFKDETGNLKKCLSIDVEGMLSLYEASFHSLEGETILDQARDFTSKFLKEYLNQNRGDHISLLIRHALEFPLHWRIPRWEAQWFISTYERKQNMNPTLLQLAKLDFNFLQTIYQDELKYTSRWWERTGLQVKKFNFCRDRLIESFIWTVGTNFNPNLGHFRRVMTKVISFIATNDDLYDTYGTLEELELFTEAVDRWDINEIDNLPDYMKTYFRALYNFIDELAYEALKKRKYDISPHLKKVWADLCKSCFTEAKWYYSGYTPSLEEYIENAKISITVPVLLSHAYFLLPHSFKKEDLVYFEECSDIIQYSAMIFRLANDLGSYKREIETGDGATSIQCYMNQCEASEEEACEHVKSMICLMWKKMNEEARISSFSQSFIDTTLNLTRMSLCMYQHGDGFTVQDLETKNLILSLIVQPIPVVRVEK